MVCRSLTHLMIAAGSVVGSALMFVSCPDKIDAAYHEPHPARKATAEALEEDAVRQELDRQVAVMADRIATKEKLIHDLVGGQKTLREVAGRFRKMNAEFPACMSVIRARYPNIPDDERMARNVLEFVRLQDLPKARLNEVESRLAEEYYQIFGHAETAPAATH